MWISWRNTVAAPPRAGCDARRARQAADPRDGGLPHKGWILGLMSAFVGVLAVHGSSYGSVLLYDHNCKYHAARQALDNLSLTYTTGDAGTFVSLLNGGTWDLVVFDQPSTWPTDLSYAQKLDAYVSGGGKLIVSSYFMAIWSFMGLTYPTGTLPYYDPPEDVYAWDATHSIFNSPHSVFALTGWEDRWGVSGMYLQPDASGVPLAGFTSEPCENRAAIVLANSGRTIANGFLFDDLNDVNGIHLVENEIRFLLDQDPAVPEPTTLIVWSGLGAVGLAAAWRRRKRAA